MRMEQMDQMDEMLRRIERVEQYAADMAERGSLPPYGIMLAAVASARTAIMEQTEGVEQRALMERLCDAAVQILDMSPPRV